MYGRPSRTFCSSYYCATIRGVPPGLDLHEYLNRFLINFLAGDTKKSACRPIRRVNLLFEDLS
jgi:hypothetical protein